MASHLTRMAHWYWQARQRTGLGPSSELGGAGGGHRGSFGDRDSLPRSATPTGPRPQSHRAGRAEKKRERTDPPYTQPNGKSSPRASESLPGHRASSLAAPARLERGSSKPPCVPVHKARTVKESCSRLSERAYPGQIAGSGAGPWVRCSREWGACA